MSTDFVVHCPKCDVHAHLGQRMGPGTSFGHGSNDEKGRRAAGEFICHHTYYESCGPLVVCTHDTLDAVVSKTSRWVEMREVLDDPVPDGPLKGKQFIVWKEFPKDE